MHRRTYGFTLIELLIVIAIIAILAAILFPVFAQAREKSRQIACLSNIKQIGLGLAMYSQDFDDTIVPWLQPTGQPRDSVRSDRKSWIDLTDPYIKNGLPVRQPNLPVGSNLPPGGVWKCPSFNAADFVASTNKDDCSGAGAIAPDALARQWFAHYAVVFPNPGGAQGSCTEDDPAYNYPGSDPVYFEITGSMIEIKRPTETVLFSEGETAISNLPNWSFYVFWGCSAAKSHQEGGNHGFADGHAKFIVGNSERVEAKDSFGCVYKKYYSIDR
jgi:prepilin-type N-terminal cleavage/methylation domain-containing protein